MEVLITGATGYIGSHLCKFLFDQGIIVDGWDTNVHGEYNDVSEWTRNFLVHDVTQPVPPLLKYDAVIHLAGLSEVPTSFNNPFEYYRVNIMGTAIQVSSIKTDHFLFASTASAWGMESPYARSKVAAEDVIKQVSENYTIFRFFNVSGSDGINKQLGEATHLIRTAAEVAAGKRDTLQIYGNDYDTPDGTCIRDYIHVVDLCESIYTALQVGPANTEYECLGTNTGSSVLEVVNAMTEATGMIIATEFAERRKGDTPVCVVDKLSDLAVNKRTLVDMCLDQYNLEKNKL